MKLTVEQIEELIANGKCKCTHRTNDNVDAHRFRWMGELEGFAYVYRSNEGECENTPEEIKEQLTEFLLTQEYVVPVKVDTYTTKEIKL